MIIKCAWHGGITGEKPPFGGKYDAMVIDGICPECEKKYFGGIIKNVRKDQITKEKTG